MQKLLMKKNICVVTGSRAEYGLLYWIMNYFNHDADINLQIIVTGMHMSPEFGDTYKQIEADGYKISYKVEMLLSSDTKSAITKSIGLGVIGFADAFENLKPDLLIVLGDRFEILSAVQSAVIYQIPVVHIHGGEITEGSVDDSFRHAITKMSHIHFVATEEYRKRVIQMGESPKTVFNFGAPGLDSIHKLNYFNQSELEESLGIKLGKINFLVTFHPVSIFSQEQNINSVKELLDALKRYPDAKIIFTKTNSDAFGRTMNKLLEDFVEENSSHCVIHSSLGHKRYLCLLRFVNVMIGNSSSAFIEAPVFNLPAVNIGCREQGRIESPSIISCHDKKEDILKAIDRALSAEFKKSIEFQPLPYGKGGDNSLKICNHLKSILFDPDFSASDFIKKKFFDLEVSVKQESIHNE
ncbi:UDP-N-acetylglucosamine 2-epimerase [Silvanigrella aquatica]|uniref:UDP-N-acetyl-D-glucosamine 2-epimerase, UDP-hydrolysing n=1 Tax=Silvanigrella aquatica TaxID=1915309 RepID=A0A1L4D2Y3_9BACT|nr:UDP-N-acetylglucosamine 2-epimerase [Silvanigrella aquatica]APJ04560.1 UDP-N-acetyl-D-glucosamine 2-epimerase, UDP-hydrolysing [Silvanigrella aquatica]